MATAAEQLVMISSYKNIWETKEAQDRNIHDFLDNVLMGRWQDMVIPIRAEKNKEKRQTLKKKVPCVTISGSFHERNETSLRAHSGFIGMDIDDLKSDVEGVREVLKNDPYVYSIFTSISGNGLCVLFKIEGEKHFEAFEGLASYLYHNYQLIVDQSGKNKSRARYVSYDPDLYLNPKALKFKKYLPKPKAQKINKVVYVKSDFDAIIKEFYDRGVNICEDYLQWVGIGYALTSQFPNSNEGRNYYHTLSSLSSLYDPDGCDRMYSSIEKTTSEGKAKKSSIATIYYYAKQNGIETYSELTKKIISSTTTLKKSGITSSQIAENLQKFEGIAVAESSDIINQAIANDIEIHGEESLITEVERWIKYNYSLSRNAITRKIENNGAAIDQKGFNTMFINCKKVHDKIDFNLFEKIIFSDYTLEYNPFSDFFKSYEDRKPEGAIDELFACINTPNPEMCALFGKKWMVSIVSAMHGQHSPLMLILAGGLQGSGKTEFLRRLLPKELKQYYAESKLDAGKDDEILMTQKLLIMDDEMGGKSKAESKRLKELTSKQTFSLREPYGRANVDLDRLAVLCGTTNDMQILNDPTGNRRLLPIEVISIDNERYNKIDKVDVIIEAYNLYKAGFKWQLSSEDVAYLNSNTQAFEDYSLEYELIQRYLKIPGADYTAGQEVVELSSTEIKVFIEHHSQQRLSLKKLGMELKSIGFESNIRFINGKTARVYRLIKLEQPESPPEAYPF